MCCTIFASEGSEVHSCIQWKYSSEVRKDLIILLLKKPQKLGLFKCVKCEKQKLSSFYKPAANEAEKSH